MAKEKEIITGMRDYALNFIKAPGQLVEVYNRSFTLVLKEIEDISQAEDIPDITNMSVIHAEIDFPQMEQPVCTQDYKHSLAASLLASYKMCGRTPAIFAQTFCDTIGPDSVILYAALLGSDEAIVYGIDSISTKKLYNRR